MRLLPKRNIRVDIVTSFLTLIGLSCLIIIVYMYHNNFSGILAIAKVMMQQLSLGLIEKMGTVTNQTELIANVIRGDIHQSGDISSANSNLLRFVTNALKVTPYANNIYIASETGNFISVGDLSFFHKYYFHFQPNQHLPEGSKYYLRVVDVSHGTFTETWSYKDSDLNTTASENSANVVYDPRIEDWYAQTQRWPRMYWNRSYNEFLKEYVLMLTLPIYDTAARLIGVIGLDISVKQLANYISHQRIGISGKTYILDEEGNVVIPELRLGQAVETDSFLIKSAHEAYRKGTDQGSLLLEKDGRRYLVYVVDFPLSPETKWYVVIIVPFDDFFSVIIQTQRKAIYICLGMLTVFCTIVFLASHHISAPIIRLAKEVEQIQALDFEERKMEVSHIVEIDKLQTSLTAMRQVLQAFGRYVPKEIVHTLLQQGRDITLGGERRDVSILFSDIANFTMISEALSIDQLTTYLSEYFEAISQMIIQSEGTIDKYIGDSLMGLWGAPQAVSDHSYKACLAALRCERVCQKAKQGGVFSWKTRFGIHSGEAVVGNIGTNERMNYTAIGNVVNIAARFQRTNKEYNTSIIISENVVERIGLRCLTRPVDFVAMRGKKNKLALYELVAAREGEEEIRATPEQIELCEAFSEAYTVLHEGKLKEAKMLLVEIKKEHPSDRLTQIYLERLSSV